MKKILPFILAVLLPTAAFAEPIKLPVAKAQAVLGALKALDGYTALDATKNKVTLFYDFSGPVHRAIRHDIIALDAAVTAWQSEMTATVADIRGQDIPPDLLALLQKAAGMAPDKQPSLTPEQQAKVAKYTSDVNAAVDKASSVTTDLMPITDADLGDNPIPGTVAEQLAPLDFTVAEPKKGQK